MYTLNSLPSNENRKKNRQHYVKKNNIKESPWERWCWCCGKYFDQVYIGKKSLRDIGNH